MAREVNKIIRPTFSDDGEEYRLRVDRADEAPLGKEYYVSVDVGGRQFEAFVPTTTVVMSAGYPVISGTLVGVIGDEVMISLPPSSMGTATWTMSKHDAMELKFAG